MRLLTHNFLQSNVKGTTKGYPLIIEADEVVVEESPVDKELLVKMLPKLDYPAFLGAAQQLSSKCNLPDLPIQLPAANDDDDMDETMLINLHKVLFDLHVIEGHLVCPDTGRKFPVKEGIPNMILHEDEI
jgi:multifunctional methyltransferase subunit TRM112